MYEEGEAQAERPDWADAKQEIAVPSDEEILALGERLAGDPTVRGMMVGERPMTNIEGLALLRLGKLNRERRAKRTGCCCPEGPVDDYGSCRHGGEVPGGICPGILREAARLKHAILGS